MVTELKRDERFTETIVTGHSEGALVGLLAAKDSAADALISIAGAGRPIDQVLSEQLEALPKELVEESEQILAQLRQGTTVSEMNEQLMSIFNPESQPFLISWMQYDPAAEISQLALPTMIINGTNDIQVSVADAELLSEAKPDAKLLLVDEMNHVLKEAPADREENLKTYADPSLPLADGLIEEIIAFLKESDLIVKHN